jgi:valyl-tRNA synthetase
MAKLRLYDEADPMRPGACYALYHVLLNVIKLLAPVLPFITERIYCGLFASGEAESIHRSIWPTADGRLLDPAAEQVGGLLVEVATAVRRYKSEHNLPLSTELAQLQLASTESTLAAVLHQSVVDLISITRAQQIQVVEQLDERLKRLPVDGVVAVALRP